MYSKGHLYGKSRSRIGDVISAADEVVYVSYLHETAWSNSRRLVSDGHGTAITPRRSASYSDRHRPREQTRLVIRQPAGVARNLRHHRHFGKYIRRSTSPSRSCCAAPRHWWMRRADWRHRVQVEEIGESESFLTVAGDRQNLQDLIATQVVADNIGNQLLVTPETENAICLAIISTRLGNSIHS